jgi:hypothetical protein
LFSGDLRADVEVAALLTAEVEPLSMKRGIDSVSLKHEAATLEVLDQGQLLLLLFLFFVPLGRGKEQEETPHGRDDQPEGNGEQEETQKSSHAYCPPGFWR